MQESTIDEFEIRRHLISYFNSYMMIRYTLSKDQFDQFFSASKRRIINDPETFARCTSKEIMLKVFEQMETEFIT